MVTAIDLSIVVPAYNEAARLADGLGRLDGAFGDGCLDPTRTEIVVVDDGSTDGTDARARDLLRHLPHVQVLRRPSNEGKGSAIRHGVAAATGAVIAFGDADMAIDPDQFPLLVTALGRSEVAIGSRTLPGSRAAGNSARRKVMGRIFNRMVNGLTKLDLGDTQCGFKGFRAPVARLLFHCTVIGGFAFDVEVLYAARQLGFHIEEVPVRWQSVEGTRIRLLADPFVMAADIVGGWARRRPPAPVPALVVAPSPLGAPSAAALAFDAAGSSFPVLADADDGATVLFPLGGREQVEQVATRLAAPVGGFRPVLRRTSVPFANLRERAPLELVGAPAVSGDCEHDILPSVS
jgi:hypothetical protein